MSSRCLGPDSQPISGTISTMTRTPVSDPPCGLSQAIWRDPQIQSELWKVPATFLEIHWKFPFCVFQLESRKHESRDTFEHKRNNGTAVYRQTQERRRKLSNTVTLMSCVVLGCVSQFCNRSDLGGICNSRQLLIIVGSEVRSTYYAAESLSWYSRDLLKHACTPLSFHNLFITPASSAVMKPSSAAPASTKSWRASSWTSEGRFAKKRKKGDVTDKKYKGGRYGSQKAQRGISFTFFYWCQNFYFSKAPLKKMGWIRKASS